jgi:hypothetical protein
VDRRHRHIEVDAANFRDVVAASCNASVVPQQELWGCAVAIDGEIVASRCSAFEPNGVLILMRRIAAGQ